METGRSRLSWSKAKLDSPFHTVILVCLVATLSYVAARLGGTLIVRPETLSPLWPGCVLLVSVLLLVPRRIWPILIAAAFGAFVLYDLQAGVPIRSIAWLILADTVEVLTAALCLSYFFDGVPQLNSVKALAKYSFFAVILAPSAGAFVGALAISKNYWTSWRVSFFSEALAFLTMMPALLSWTRKVQAWEKKSGAYYLEAAALTAALVLLGYITLVAPGRNSSPALLYALVPVLLWSALRFGSMGTSTSVVVVTFLAIWGAVHGRGPFTEPEPINELLALQVFLFFTAAPFMVLAALVEEHEQNGQVLRESENRFRLLADTAPVLIWMSGTDRLCTYFNKFWLDFTGRSIDSQLGNGWAEGVHPEDLQRCLDTYTRAFDRREEFRMEYRLRRHDGEYQWVFDIGVPRFNQDRSFVGYIGTGVDVTERKQAEDALRANEEKLRLLLDSSAEAIYGIDLEGRCTFCNRACLRALGYERADELLGKNIHQLIHHSRADGTLFPQEECGMLGALRTGEGVHVEDEVLWRANGTSFPVEYWSYPQRRGQEVVGVVVAFFDITERNAAEAALASVSSRLIEAQEKERARIARELHDDIGQRLALLTIELDQLGRNSPDLRAEVRSRIVELHSQTSELATDIQFMSHDLHSSKLEYLGLTTAMKGFCKEFSEQQRVEVLFAHDDIPSTIPQEVSLCLFRVLQEALQNAVKHSGVRHFDVELRYVSDTIHLTVRDSGSGFDVEQAMNTSGLGLVSMAERVKLVDGRLSIDSQPQRGTAICTSVPLSKAARASA